MLDLVGGASARCATKSAIRLVGLPQDAEKRLAEALHQPRVGFVGLLESAPAAKALLDLVKDKVSPVDTPWAASDLNAQYLPVEVKTTHPDSPKDQKGPKGDASAEPKALD
jgi:RNase P subunit Pop3